MSDVIKKQTKKERDREFYAAKRAQGELNRALYAETLALMKAAAREFGGGDVDGFVSELMTDGNARLQGTGYIYDGADRAVLKRLAAAGFQNAN